MLCLLLATGCYLSHRVERRPTDGGLVGRMDAGGLDAGPRDAGRDAGVDAGGDAGVDAGRDAGVDAFVPRDAGPIGCPVPEPSPPVGVRTPAIVTWGSTTSSTACFFFSGPGALGRDDMLGASATWTSGEARTMFDFGSGVRFFGTTPSELTRRTCHDFGGVWHVTERFALVPSPSGWMGRYSYEECQVGVGPCPGRCRIDADVAIAPGP
jgi:hypothetical protein